jgi:hypothetical protein
MLRQLNQAAAIEGLRLGCPIGGHKQAAFLAPHDFDGRSAVSKLFRRRGMAALLFIVSRLAATCWLCDMGLRAAPICASRFRQ